MEESSGKCLNCQTTASSGHLCLHSSSRRLCKRCHQYLDEYSFCDENVCISCSRRHRSAVHNTFQEVSLPTSCDLVTFDEFLTANKDIVSEVTNNALKEHRSLKVFIRTGVNFERVVDDSVQRTTGWFRTDPVIVSDIAHLDIGDIVAELNSHVENFNVRGSSWQMRSILEMTLCFTPYLPLQGSSYIPTPKYILDKKAIVNIQNKDNYCFLYSILAGIQSDVKGHRSRVLQYQRRLHELNYATLQFPLKFQDVSKFEDLNLSISVNVFLYSVTDPKEGFYTLHVTKHRDRLHHVDLLLLEDGDKCHYTLISDKSRLVGDRNKHKTKSWVCDYCLHAFSSREVLDGHLSACKRHEPQTTDYPGGLLKFKNVKHSMRVPFVLYIDFESFLKPTNNEGSRVRDIHEPSGFCIYRVSQWPQHDKNPYVYSCEQEPGVCVMDKFYECIMKERDEISEILGQNVKMMELTYEEKLKFERAGECFNCKKKFTSNNCKVRHHCHVTGKFIDACCNNCNLQLKFDKQKLKSANGKRNDFFIPVIAHNMKGYDSHHILKHLQRKHIKNGTKFDEVTVIPTNTEQFISFSIGKLRFIDSFQFLASSLDDLTSILLKSGRDKFRHAMKHIDNKSDEELIFQKGHYPYEFMTDKTKFELTELPPKEAFYSKLTEKNISKEGYKNAAKTWNVFECKTMRDYHDHYLKTDVLLLADVFENFRNLCMSNFQLDPAHYFTLPGFAWDACLKTSGVNLQLLDDPNISLFFENALRGGVSCITQRFAKANNPEAGNYNPEEPTSYITYLDCNNLYGTVMANSKFPTGGFKFWSEEEISKRGEEFESETLPTDGELGYVLEVDLEYPESLHDKHNDYPLAPEKLTVGEEMLSPYARSFPNKPRPSEKLIPNLQNKEKYVVHYANLKLYLKLGMKLRRIHRVVEFTQEAWMKSYVNFCTEMRKLATSDFEKDFWKLCVNAVFGKSMENVRNRVNVRLIHDRVAGIKAASKPTFVCSKIINEDLVMVQNKVKQLKMNKPIFTGCCILELSKALMYDFHYNHIVDLYGDNARLLFTDTDSLCYHITTANLYKDMKRNESYYDTSNFDPDHPNSLLKSLFSKTNAKVLGKFKSETGSLAPLEFVGLRAKMYSLLVDEKEEEKAAAVSNSDEDEDEDKTKSNNKMAAKGIKKSCIKKHIHHSTFVNTLNTRTADPVTFHTFASNNQQLETLEIKKVGLSAYDDKRYLREDGIRSYAYGHTKAKRMHDEGEEELPEAKRLCY